MEEAPTGTERAEAGAARDATGPLRWLDLAIEFLLAAVLVVLVCIGGAQVIYRFVLNSPMAWVEEVSIILLVWVTMLSGYIGVRRNIHLMAEASFDLKPGTRWALELACLVLCLVFTGVYGVGSLKVIDAMDGIPFTSIPVQQPALYWSLPVSAVLMAIALVARMHRHFGQRPSKIAKA